MSMMLLQGTVVFCSLLRGIFWGETCVFTKNGSSPWKDLGRENKTSRNKAYITLNKDTVWIFDILNCGRYVSFSRKKHKKWAHEKLKKMNYNLTTTSICNLNLLWIMICSASGANISRLEAIRLQSVAGFYLPKLYICR